MPMKFPTNIVVTISNITKPDFRIQMKKEETDEKECDAGNKRMNMLPEFIKRDAKTYVLP